MEASLAELTERLDVEPPDDEHDPDAVTAYERAQLRSLAGAARARVAAIDARLAGAEGLDDELGRCGACGDPIGAERLDALPDATRCIACAAAGG